MAKLNNSDSSVPFAAAVTAMSLGMSKRLMRNFRYYQKHQTETITRNKLREICRDIRFDIFSLQNLYLNRSNQRTGDPFKVMIAKRVSDRFEELHRKLLFFDVDNITAIIPIVDQQRRFWDEAVEPRFYDNDLPQKLQQVLSTVYPSLEKHIKKLPEKSTQ